jgi:putative transposase
MLKAYKYRIYPNKKQKEMICRTTETCRILYNDFLFERKFMYEYDKSHITYSWQQDSLPYRKRINPYLQSVHSQVLQDVARRVDKAFKNFFQRVNAGDKPGYPRFKGKGQYNSFTYPQSGYCIEGNKLKLSCIGGVKVKLHRPVEGKIKTCTIICKNGKYYAGFACEIEAIPLPMTGKAVGIDMGIENFCMTSDGEYYASPKTYRKAEKALKKAQRKVARRKKGGNRRKKAVKELAKAHERVSNQRKDIAHKVALDLVRKYDFIAYEDLTIKNMVQSHHLAKSIADAGWGMFFRIIDYKAESAGKSSRRINPYKSSQECSECGTEVPKKLSQQWHDCPNCGNSEHRDKNAAKVILKRGMRQIA